ncbi:hypothetical protein QBC46DRAFT_20960 [Diplogelasinospora grovesii]|uniref:Uncharacterized protein n=1 Tax=Diplogelasinospora grovesii TaxID=303347 RepID=A0AAN6S205_9PEZI|nr:hypothetical protein QBC46DRAFT_20960 [Diplogelasinospora grovesii]
MLLSQSADFFNIITSVLQISLCPRSSSGHFLSRVHTLQMRFCNTYDRHTQYYTCTYIHTYTSPYSSPSSRYAQRPIRQPSISGYETPPAASWPPQTSFRRFPIHMGALPVRNAWSRSIPRLSYTKWSTMYVAMLDWLTLTRYCIRTMPCNIYYVNGVVKSPQCHAVAFLYRAPNVSCALLIEFVSDCPLPYYILFFFLGPLADSRILLLFTAGNGFPSRADNSLFVFWFG